MNILVLNGSPRPNGNTAAMVAAFAEGASENGHNITVVSVCQKKIAGCLACEYCHTNGEGKCVQQDDMQKLIIEVGDKTFTAALYDSETVTAFTEMLPLTLNMSELNGNEKYYYLDDSLPTDSKRPSGIKEGDIMLYGSSCLVLFYESFSTSYSYTPIGHIDDPSGLAKALGKKSVEVTFRLK